MGNLETMCFLVMDRVSHSTCIASSVVQPRVFVMTSMGTPASLRCYSLGGMPEDLESFDNFLRMVLNFLWFKRLSFCEMEGSRL